MCKSPQGINRFCADPSIGYQSLHYFQIFLYARLRPRWCIRMGCMVSRDLCSDIRSITTRLEGLTEGRNDLIS